MLKKTSHTPSHLQASYHRNGFGAIRRHKMLRVIIRYPCRTGSPDPSLRYAIHVGPLDRRAFSPASWKPESSCGSGFEIEAHTRTTYVVCKKMALKSFYRVAARRPYISMTINGSSAKACLSLTIFNHKELSAGSRVLWKRQEASVGLKSPQQILSRPCLDVLGSHNTESFYLSYSYSHSCSC